MSKVLLISSNTLTEPYPTYPLGMAIVASVLSSRGHSILQYDFLAETQALESLRDTMMELTLTSLESLSVILTLLIHLQQTMLGPLI